MESRVIYNVYFPLLQKGKASEAFLLMNVTIGYGKS